MLILKMDITCNNSDIFENVMNINVWFVADNQATIVQFMFQAKDMFDRCIADNLCRNNWRVFFLVLLTIDKHAFSKRNIELTWIGYYNIPRLFCCYILASKIWVI